jgi:imidazolonepropionase-like amidohydrolase
VKAKVVVSPDETLPDARLIIRNGLIAAVGKDVAIPNDAQVIDADGLTVYAGFIDAATSDAVDSTKLPSPPSGRPIDFGRYALAASPPDNRKSLTPDFIAADALKLDAPQLENRRKLGFTSLHVVPSGRIASGMGSLVTTSGAPLRESLVASPSVAEFQLFAVGSAGYPNTMMGAFAHLRQAFSDAKHHALQHKLYREGTRDVERPPHDAGLDALFELLEQHRTPLFAVNSEDDIRRALVFCDEHQLKPLLWGAKDAFQCVDELKLRAIGVLSRLDFGDEPKIESDSNPNVLDPKKNDPQRVQRDRLDRWKRRVAGPARLAAVKVPFALSSEGLKDPGELLKAVRQTIKAGLSRDAALAALTRDAAVLLGQQDRLGTLAPGKLAHVVAMTGPFDDERSKVRFVFVDGLKFEYHKDAQPVPPGSPAGSELNVTGLWNVEIESADGKVPAQLDLRQSQQAINGVFRSNQGDGKVTSGKLTDKKLELVIAIGVGAQALELKLAADLDPAQRDSLAGTLRSAFGAATKWTAARKSPPPPTDAKPDAGKNPVQLTLDDANPAANAKAANGDSLPNTEQPTELDSDRRRRGTPTSHNLFVKNGVVFTSGREFVSNTSVLIKQGKIAAIGPDLKPDDGMEVLDAAGRYVIPGLLDTHSHIMFADGLGGVNEATLSRVPEVRVKDVVRSDDPASYRARAGGLTTARLLHGSANTIGGQDAVVKMKYGEPATNQILRDNPQGVKFALGENVKFQTGRFPNTRIGVEATINRAFLEAADYRRRWMEHNAAIARLPADAARPLPPRRDLRLEALAGILDHQIFIHSHCYRADEILMLLRVTSNVGIRVWSLQHVLEGYKVAPEIVAHGASCSTFSDWWAYKHEAYDATPYNLALLLEAGANVVIKSDDPELIRHMYLEAAKTVRYGGLTPEQALRTITLNSAKELGIADRVGSIDVGKDADLAIFSGHPLSSLSRCETTIIDGEIVFVRATQPSAMSEAAAAASAQTPPLELPTAEVRAKKLDLTPSPSHHYALVGATVHPVDSADIVDGALLIDGEKIAAVGARSVVQIPTDAKVIDVAGLHLYPGLIDAGTTVGLVEIGKVRETHDDKESGQFQPDLRAAVAVNPDSELIPVARAGGITTLLIRPSGGIISGQASIIKLDGWTVPEMTVNLEAGLQITWPGGKDTEKPIEELREFLAQGRLYHQITNGKKSEAGDQKSEVKSQRSEIVDPRFEALGPYLRGEKPVFVEANTYREIAEALLFADKEKLKIVITGGADAWKLAAELKKRDVPVVLGPVMRAPVEEYDPFDTPYAASGRLHEAGVTFCIRSNHGPNSRNAPFEAAMAAAYGLPRDEALKAVTQSAAKVLGLDDRYGSLTAGKLANVIVSDGSPLQQTSQYKAIFIHGRPYAPESRHTRLYEKYRGRLQEVRSKQGQPVAGP